MPADAIPDCITRLHESFFNFFAHFGGRRRPEGGHLTVPAAGEFLAQVHEARKLAQGLKVFREARASVLYFGCLDEMAPGFVSKKSEGTKLATTLEMGEDLARDALLIFERKLTRKLRAVLEERFLRVRSFAMNEADRTDQLVPGLAVRGAIFAGVNGGQLSLFFSRKRFDRLCHVGQHSLPPNPWA